MSEISNTESRENNILNNEGLANKKFNFGGRKNKLLIIVAAIIVVLLIAIAVLLSNGPKAEKDNEASDIANMQAAKAAAVIAYATDGSFSPDRWSGYYDPKTDSIVHEAPAAYGRGTEKDGGADYPDYNSQHSYKGKVLKVFHKDDDFIIRWQ